MMRIKSGRSFPFLPLLLLGLIVTCTGDKKKDEETRAFELLLNPGTEKESKIDEQKPLVPTGKKILIRYTGKNKDCKDCLFEWRRGENIIGISPEITITFCQDGQNSITFSVISSGGTELEKKEITFLVTKSEYKKTDDVLKALNIFKNDVLIIGVEKERDKEIVRKLSEAVDSLQKYINTENSCDVDSIYALTLAKIVLILSEIQNIVVEYFSGTLKKEEIVFLIDKVIKPSKTDLESVINSGSIPSNFSFKVRNLQIYVIRDFPQTQANEKLYLNLSGEHDLTDFYFLSSFIGFIVGGFEVVLAYNLAMEFVLDLPPKVTRKIEQGISLLRIVVEEFVEYLVSNPAFLGLAVDAHTRLKEAQATFYNSFRNLQRMVDSLANETDDQTDDIIRYWDCGKDRVCPNSEGDPYADINGNRQRDDEEPYLDLNKSGHWNPAWSRADQGENNKKYDIGELIGTEKLKTSGNEDGIFLSLSGQTGDIAYKAIFQNKAFDVIAQNILGGILDIGRIIGQSNENLKDLMCSLGISFPEIRLWEFFITPTSLRDILPRWDADEKTIIIQRDTEGFSDTGLDRKFSWNYQYYHPLSNPDPEVDDGGPGNESDGVDTDDDGRCANKEGYTAWRRKERGEQPRSERDCINFIGSGIDGNDLGTEGNLLFDWKDKNNNKVPDLGDVTEEWNDEGGILNGRGENCGDVVVKRNNKYDVCDSQHFWPDGRSDPKNTIGAGGMICRGGAYKGDDKEVIDLVYLLFPDPTFSGVLRLYKGEGGVVKNKEGEALNENALLHRTIWKGVVFLNIIDNYPYR